MLLGGHGGVVAAVAAKVSRIRESDESGESPGNSGYPAIFLTQFAGNHHRVEVQTARISGRCVFALA
jgi:hypothetical protein